MWLAYTIQLYYHVDLGNLGVYPRSFYGVIGIIFAPMIHGNTAHLISNTFPILILGATLFLFYPKVANLVFYVSYFLPSIFVWIFGRPFLHIGASGFVYSLALFLISTGLFRRDRKSVLIAIIIIIIYGSVLFNVSNLRNEVSWESHVFGSLVGVGIAYGIYKTRVD